MELCYSYAILRGAGMVDGTMATATCESSRDSWQGLRIYTVGHSTRTVEELLAVLASFEVSVLADIRTVPRSRHNPQFNADELARVCSEHGIRYAHLPKLGGLRRPRRDSPNTGWRNASFRGYADYMQTADFESGLTELHALGRDAVIAIMCAEAVHWRCHRSLVADALLVRGAQVEHLSAISRSAPHSLTPFARVRGGCITYPAPEGSTTPQIALF